MAKLYQLQRFTLLANHAYPVYQAMSNGKLVFTTNIKINYISKKM
jgi:hypothetical protein